MKVGQAEAVRLFQSLGIPQASGWDKEVLTERLATIKDLLEDAFEVEGDDKELLESILETQRDGQNIKVVMEQSEGTTKDSDVEVEAPTHEKKSKEKSMVAVLEKKKSKKKVPVEVEVQEAEKTKKVKKKADEGKEPEKTKKVKKVKEKKDAGPSNKGIAYKAWMRSKDKSTKIAETVQELVPEVKVSTVKSWIGAWNRGQNLPAIAKNGDGK